MLAIMLAKNISQQYLKIHWQYLNKHYHSLQQNHLCYDKSKSVIQSGQKSTSFCFIKNIYLLYIKIQQNKKQKQWNVPT